jgi:hypothetical protein
VLDYAKQNPESESHLLKTIFPFEIHPCEKNVTMNTIFFAEQNYIIIEYLWLEVEYTSV